MVSKLLKNFTGVSLREETSIKLVKEKLNITADCVIDPTMLFEKEFYLNYQMMPVWKKF